MWQKGSSIRWALITGHGNERIICAIHNLSRGRILRIALGPLQYYWPRDIVIGFYDAIAAAPVDIVYLGETVC